MIDILTIGAILISILGAVLIAVAIVSVILDERRNRLLEQKGYLPIEMDKRRYKNDT